ncbi:helix-turn-helix transcriptional regulator [Herbiconiux solani]|uniref:helix-turn-helix transcriptional regulator n=1 Tax=Herbiconiux solani TaxID=661329 RepID=UPI000A050EBE|nr:helix-turn-helix transcriptional regulator [Herbiconiux solani]
MVDSPLGEYLRVRRASLRPEDVGLRSMSGRRVEGLRRDEVAQLAGISPEYYLRIEQGRGHQPSDQVLRSLARALKLDANAIQYMTRLIGIQSGVQRAAESQHLIQASLGPMIDQWSTMPAFVTDKNQTVVLVNELAKAILPGGIDLGTSLVLKIFSRDWRASDVDWETTAHRALAALRFHADPSDLHFQDIIGLLSMRDEDFRRIWAAHAATPMDTSELHLDVAGFGRVEFSLQSLRPAGDENHLLTVLHAEAESAAADMVKSLRVAHASTNTHAGFGNHQATA